MPGAAGPTPSGPQQQQGTPAAAAAGAAVSGATTVQQGQESSFNVSVDYGRFAPLMGAPLTLNMTPGAASGSGVTGPAGTTEFSFPDMSQVRAGVGAMSVFKQFLVNCISSGCKRRG
jgi:hypothetical protein